MRVHYTVCCGIDVHKNSVTACLMWGPANREPQSEIRRFATMSSDLKKLAEWLNQAQCEVAVMESTGAYWKPVWNILEGHLKLILANAHHVRALPGEKTDNKDGKRLASLMRHGLIRPSFIPSRDIRELRDLTRYRKKLLANATAERNRIQKILEDGNIKLASVLTDMFGISGRRMLRALVEEESINVEHVVALAHWSLEPKMESLKKALEGRLTVHHRFMIQTSLDHMAYIDRQVFLLDEQIAKRLLPYQKEYELLQTIRGIGESAAAVILAEIGPDMSQFPDDNHLASWTGVCPGNNESGGKKFSSATRKGNPHLMSNMVESAWAAARKKNCHFKSKYYTVKARRGAKRAVVAVAHDLVRTVFFVLQSGQPYREPMRTPLAESQRFTKAQRLCARLRNMGFDVMLKPKTRSA